MSEYEKLREALVKIAETAKTAIDDPEYVGVKEHAEYGHLGIPICSGPRPLPKHLLETAALNAVQINPVNAPAFGPLAALTGIGIPSDPLRIAVLTSKYWGPAERRLTVSFMETTPADLRSRIISHMNTWTRTGGISFVETQGTGDVRISRGPGGYWSYLGTDITLIPSNRQTMNLEGFTMSTPDSEYRRVVRHEAGHTLGFLHEHMRRELVERIDPERAYEYFLRTQGWDRQTVNEQVLTPVDERSIIGTPADQTSIMTYQLPGSITRDGRPIIGGLDINQTDFDFAGRIYPKTTFSPSVAPDEWEPEYAPA